MAGPILSEAVQRALREALASPERRIYCAPASAGLAPTARWNVCNRLMDLGFVVMKDGPRSGKIWQFDLTGSGAEAARKLEAGRQHA